VAAALAGHGAQVGYAQLVERLLGVTVDKSETLTDWSRRPLSEAQVNYAVSDVTHLVTVYQKLKADLERSGRTDWVGEEMKVLTSPATYMQEPEHAWERLKSRVRKPKDLAVLIEVAAWREREAQARDVPRQRVLKDEAIAEIAMQQPKTAEALANMRFLSRGLERSKTGEAILAAVAAGLARDPKTLPRLQRPRPLSNGASATVELLKVLLRMSAERHGVAAKVLATTDDLEKIAADDAADVPALKGWRRELFGEQALKLKRGELSLAVENGRVVPIGRYSRPDYFVTIVVSRPISLPS